MTDDFNIRFGSNAKAFSSGLIRDLKPAREELVGFIKLLGDVDHASKTALGRAGQALGGAHPTPGVTPNAGGGATSGLAAPKIDMSGVEREIHSMTADLDGMIGKLNTVITSLGRAVPGIENFVKKQNYSQGSRGKYDAGTDTPRGAGGKYSSSGVRDSDRFGFNSKVIADAIKARDAKLSQPAKVDFSGITKLQLDQAGFDRVVGKLEEIKAAITARGGAARVVEAAAAATPAAAKGGKKTKGKEVEESLAVTAKEADQLRADLKKAQELVVKKFGGQAPAEITAGIDAMRKRMAAMDARSEREASGVSRGDQSAQRRAKADADRKKFDDLDRAEYDARKRRLELIQDAGRSDFEESATRRGKGGTSKNRLVETAQAFQDVGFDVQYGRDTTKPELAKRIASARQAYEAQHGSDIPESLQTGRPPRGPDKISNSMRDLLGDIDPHQLEQERQARETRRLAYLTGNLPKEPTGRATSQTPGAINVPPGMVKGGQYYDAFGFLQAGHMLDSRALSRASSRAKDPGFNPHAINERENIEGGGEAAKLARTQFRELKRATRELDKLGEEYDNFSKALVQNRELIHRIDERAGTEGEKPGDVARRAQAVAQVGKAHDTLDSARFGGLQELFESPEYQAGRRTRTITRTQQEEAAQARAAERPTYVNDAAASAIAGARTGIGFRGFTRPIPGLRPDGQSLAFTDDQRNPTELRKLKSAFAKYQKGLKREVQLAEDLAAGVEGITEGHVKAEIAKTDNQVTKFLNEVNHLFGKGVAPTFEGITGRAPQTEKAIKDEATRVAERAQMNALKTAKPQKPSDTQVAVQRAKDVERTKKLLAKADEELTAAEKAETAAVKKAEKSTAARPKAEQDALAERRKLEQRVASLMGSLPGNVFPDVETPHRLTKSGATPKPRLDQKPRRDMSDEELARYEDYREYQSQHQQRLAVARQALNAGASRPSDLAPVTAGSRALLEAQGRPGAKPILERGPGQWLKDLAGMDPKKVNGIMKDIGSTLKAGEHGLDQIAAELERWQRSAKRIGEVSGDKKLTQYDPSDPRYGRGSAAAGSDPLANALHRLSSNELDHRVRAEGSSGAPEGVKIKDFLDQKRSSAAADAYTAHLGKGMAPELVPQLKEFVKAAGRFVAGKGHHEGVDDPAFDVLRKMASGAPTVGQPLYRGLGRAPRFDENGMLLGSTQKLSSWTGDQTTASMFGQHQLKMAGGQALNLGSMGGMEEYLAQGQYKHIRSYQDPENPQRTIHEVEQQQRAKEVAQTKEEKAASQAATQAATAKARRDSLQRALEARQGRADAAQAAIGGKDPEAATLQKRLTRSQNLRKELATLRSAVKAAVTAEDAEAAAIAREERDAFKKKNQRYLLSRAEQKQLRSRIAGLNAGGAGEGGGGGAAPTAGGAEYEGGRGGQLSVLRQILASVNGIREQIRTGVRSAKGTGTAADGTPVTRTPAGSTSLTRLRQSQSDDEREKAKAAVAQQRDLERLERSGVKEQEILVAQSRAIKENARYTQAGETVTRKATETELARARAQMMVKNTMANLDTASRAELDKLRQLIKSGADNTKVVEQQARAYAAMNRSLAGQGVTPGGERHKQIRDVLSETQGSKLSGPAVDDIRRSAASVDGFKTVDKSMASQVPGGGIFGEQSAFTKAMFGNHGFWSRVMASTGTFVVRNFTAGFVFGLTNALQDVVRQAIITESTFIRVSDALEQTGRSSGNLRTQLQGISSQYGTNLEDVYETAAGLTGLFDKIDDIAGATRVVSQLQSISMGALNATEAMGALASITGAYGDQLKGGTDGLTQVADVLTVVQNVIGTNVETTAEGVGALSGLSKQLKIDFEDTAVYVAQIAKLTNQTGAAAGDQFSRILAAMQTGRGRASLTKNLKGTGIEAQLGSGNYGGALQTLLKNWDNLSDGQQRNIAVTVAGQRQARAFYALMNNSTKVLDASARAHDAQGQAAQRAAAIANTLNGLIAKLTSNLTNLAQNLVRTGLLDFFGVLLHVVNGLLSGVNHVFSVINDFADSNPILNFLKHVTAGLVGFLVTAKLAQLAFRGFRASLGELRAGEGVMAAGVQGALGKGGVPAGPTLRQSLRNAPGALGGYAQRVRNPRPRITDYVTPQPGTPIPGRPAEPQSAIKQVRPVQGPMLPGGGFYSNAPDEARVTRTSRAMGGMSNAMDRVKSSALGAQLGVTAAFALIFAAIDGLAEHAARADEYRKIYKEQTGHTSSTESGPNFLSKTSRKIGDLFGGDDQKAAESYIGPYTEQMQKNIKQSSGLWGGLKAGLAEGIGGLNPHRWNDKDFWGLDAEKPIDRAKGKLDDDTQKQLDDLTKSLAKPPPNLRSIDGQGRIQGPASDVVKLTAAQKIGRKEIDAAIKKIDEDTSLTEEQRTTAMAGIEKLQKAYAENMNRKILAAQGVASQDVLSSDQLSKLSGVTSMLVNTATSGGGVDARTPQYADLFKKRLEDTGIRTGSTIGKSLNTLAQGGLNKGDALAQVRTINNEAIKQLQSKIKSMQGTADPEEIDQLQSVLDQFVQDQSGILQQIIDGISASATAIADVASGRGHYKGAAGAIRSARNRVAGLRDRDSESPEIRAQRDSVSAQQSERAAELETQGQTWRLARQKARGVGAQRSAQIDAQSARVAYNNLILERQAAQAAGAEGPTITAIREAKNSWLAAQRSSAMAAQDANIAAMTAAAAGLWNGTATAAAQEGIALQQYANAKKNFGANSTEALNALAAYKGAQKSVITTMDQVAEATRQAGIASIPQGNAVAVARAQVASARAGVAAAEKYGHNSTEYQGALSQLYSAQQQAQSAQAAVRTAQAQLAQAYATARGDTVGAARAGERVARAQLAAAKKASGGANSADVLAAKASAVQARAATRDAILQDRLDTIDFNLQMGKITQSSAISAMQQILRTANLTKQQRRDLLLKIKGMKDAIADTQWNFGSMELPTPYQMRRYVQAEAMNAAQKKMTPYRDSTSLNLADRSSRGGEPGYVADNRTVYIDGADTAKVRAILTEILGKSVKTRTAQGRRR